MTVVLAKRFGDLIEVVSDTTISDSSEGREDAFPGRLKIITLATDLTIAYAGHSNPALHEIRELLRRGVTRVEDILHALERWTASPDHDVEFLVLSHQPQADLRRVWSGRVSNSLEDAALGDATIRQAVYDRFKRTGNDQKDASDFHFAFLAAFTSPHVDRGPGVGGFPVCVKASSAGHYYRSHAFHFDWKPIEFMPGVEQHQNPADMQTGDWTFHHSVIAPKAPGVAVLAAQIQQARRAYIYSPLFEDDPSPVVLLEPDVDWTEHQDLMNQLTSAALELEIERARHKGNELKLSRDGE